VSDLRVAAARVDVTPPSGGPLAGYGARGAAVAQGVHDPLEATLVWLRDEAADQDVVWVGLDVVGADEEISRSIASSVAAAIGRPGAVVLVCASHTHSSAADWFRRPTPGVDGFGPVDDGDGPGSPRRVLVERIAEAAGRMPRTLRRARLLAVEGQVNGVGANRHRPDGPHDPSAGILAALDDHGRVVAVVTDHGSHPTVLGHDNLLWSADWPGAARRALSGALASLTPFPGSPGAEPAPPPVVLFLQGAAGNSSARFVRRGQTFAEADRLGGRYASQVLGVLLDAPERPLAGPLRVCRATVALPTRSVAPVSEALAAERQAHADWDAVRRTQPEGSPAERIARTRHEGALAARRMAEAGLPPTLDLPLTVVTCGERAWVHLPVELFASFALRIRAASPFPSTRVVGYTDGYFGYVADADAHRDGVYEAGVSLFDADAGDRLCEAAIALLQETALLRETTHRPAATSTAEAAR
jgi:hypothetical protein